MSGSFYVDTHINFTRQNKIEAVGSLSNDDVNGNENSKNALIGLDWSKKFLRAHHAFLCISLPSLHDYDVEVPSFTFFEGRGHKSTTVVAGQIQFLNDFFVAVAVVLA